AAAGSAPQLFGAPLAFAVQVAGVRVGRVAASGEACVVPTVVAECGRHLWDHAQQTQGIFRVNGSMKRVQRLQEAFNTAPAYGRDTRWDGYTLHDAATLLRRYLTSLPLSVIAPEHYSAFMDKLADDAVPDPSDKARDFGAMIAGLDTESRHTLLFMLELLAGFARAANSARTLMNSSNLAAVLQPCLLVHPGHVANPHEYSRAKDVVEFLIVHAAEMYRPEDNAGACAGEEKEGGGEGGLIVFDAREKGVASDDGTTTLDAGANESRGPQQQSQEHIHIQQQNRWSSAFTRESTATAVQSDHTPADAAQHAPADAAQHAPTQMPAEAAHNTVGVVPPRGDSLVTMSMVMSTPVLGSRAVSSSAPAVDGRREFSSASSATQVRSLGSVTARLYDPESPQEHEPREFGSHSNVALSSIQYQYTVPTRARETGSVSTAEPATVAEPRSPPATRPRRSLSFVVAPATTTTTTSAAGDGAERMDEYTQDIINRSTNAVHARRAGHVVVPTVVTPTVTVAPLGLGNNRFKKLPPIPQRVVSATASIPRALTENLPQPMQQQHEVRRTAAATFDSGSGFHIYPHTQKQQPRTASM
ncbi:GTPase activating protein (GAP) for Rho1p, partial [Coemansia sp. RSA 2618]